MFQTVHTAKRKPAVPNLEGDAHVMPGGACWDLLVCESGRNLSPRSWQVGRTASVLEWAFPCYHSYPPVGSFGAFWALVLVLI